MYWDVIKIFCLLLFWCFDYSYYKWNKNIVKYCLLIPRVPCVRLWYFCLTWVSDHQPFYCPFKLFISQWADQRIKLGCHYDIEEWETFWLCMYFLLGAYKLNFHLQRTKVWPSNGTHRYQKLSSCHPLTLFSHS